MSHSEIWKPNVVVAAIVEREGRFLIVEEYADSDQLVRNQPAGHLDAGETLLDAVVRETREETAWRFTPQALVGVYRLETRAFGGTTYLRFCFCGAVDQHDPVQPLDDGVQRAVWLSREELAARPEMLRSQLVLRCIDDFRAGRRYPLELIADFPLAD
ncbi:MAG: NUDIX hydrolase [Chromatiales bacterium]|nr:NUDIX hydrolase [Chromatiales bacterium]